MVLLESISLKVVPVEDIPSQGSDDDFNVSKSSSLAVAGYESNSGWQPPANMNYVIVRKR